MGPRVVSLHLVQPLSALRKPKEGNLARAPSGSLSRVNRLLALACRWLKSLVRDVDEVLRYSGDSLENMSSGKMLRAKARAALERATRKLTES